MALSGLPFPGAVISSHSTARLPVRDYHLKQRPPDAIPRDQVRLKTANPPKLRRGGGRKDSVGWTEQKRGTNRRRFDALRPHIQTAVTIIYPAKASPQQLAALDQCTKNFCRERRLPARCVWEGPGYHQHIALGIRHDADIERRWINRLAKWWLREFGLPLSPDTFLWKPEIEPDRIASYLSKTWTKGRLIAKGAFAWMIFPPCWETGLRWIKSGKSRHSERANPRKNCVKPATPSKPSHALSPHYTVSGGNPSERVREICPVCWSRWGKSLWAGSCKCNPAFPNC
jgi:hypothetical protein